MIQHSPNCFMLLRHAMPWALVFALASAGNSKPARRAMMAITTRSSMRVNPQELLLKDSNGDWARRSVITMRLFKWNNAYSKKEGKATVRLRAQLPGLHWLLRTRRKRIRRVARTCGRENQAGPAR